MNKLHIENLVLCCTLYYVLFGRGEFIEGTTKEKKNLDSYTSENEGYCLS